MSERTQSANDALKSFRQCLAAKNLLTPSQDQDHTLLKFLKALNYNLDKATHNWEEMIKWRKINQVDETTIQDFVYEECEEVKRFYPRGFHGVDKEGRPLYIDCLGRAKFKDMFDVTTRDRFLKAHIQAHEKDIPLKCQACSLRANKHIDSITRIVDLHGKSWKHLRRDGLDLFRAARVIDSYCYPETVHRFIYVNAGIGLRLTGNLYKLSVFLRGWDSSRLYFLGSTSQKENKHKLLKYIEEDQLPKFLGGSCPCPGDGGCLRFEKGPWEDAKGIQGLLDADMQAGLSKNEAQTSPSPFQMTQKIEKDPLTMLRNEVRELSAKIDRLEAKDREGSIGQAKGIQGLLDADIQAGLSKNEVQKSPSPFQMMQKIEKDPLTMLRNEVRELSVKIDRLEAKDREGSLDHAKRIQGLPDENEVQAPPQRTDDAPYKVVLGPGPACFITP